MSDTHSFAIELEPGVEFMEPHAVLQLVGRPEIARIAAAVRERLQRVMAAL